MKLKATVSDVWEGASLSERYALAKLVIDFSSPAFTNQIYDEVLVPYMRIPARNSDGRWHAGDYFNQETDRSSPWDLPTVGIDVTLSGVSVTLRRATVDLWDALNVMTAVYKERIEKILMAGIRAHLMVRMALDKPIEYLDRQGNTPLPEHPTIWVPGKAAFKDGITEDTVLEAELMARLGPVTGQALFQRFLALS